LEYYNASIAKYGRPFMNSDTDLGGQHVGFPATSCSLVRATGHPDPAVRRRAFDAVIAAYWKPVYKYIRIKWKQSNEDAKDLTQAFFARAMEKGFFDRFDPGKSRFRTFVRLCVDRFVGNSQRCATSEKRGGQVKLLSLDFAAADEELRRISAPAAMDPDQFFQKEWARGLFELAVADLCKQCAESNKATHFALFQSYDLQTSDARQKRPTYAQLGQQFGLSATQVTNYLASVRRQFRQLILDRLAATTATEEEFQDEARLLLGGAMP
jgi:RNA polymerase sigma factor (sigma-70 family)